MERQEMVFKYGATGEVEIEEMQTALRYDCGIESEIEFYDDYMILVWYE